MTDLAGALAHDRLVAVIRHQDPEVAAGIARAAHTGGLRALEITMTAPARVPGAGPARRRAGGQGRMTTIMDALVGYAALWDGGIDHAG